MDSAFSTCFLQNKNNNERARRDWGSTQTWRRPAKSGEGPEKKSEAVWRRATCKSASMAAGNACAPADGSDADAELMMPKGIYLESP